MSTPTSHLSLGPLSLLLLAIFLTPLSQPIFSQPQSTPGPEAGGMTVVCQGRLGDTLAWMEERGISLLVEGKPLGEEVCGHTVREAILLINAGETRIRETLTPFRGPAELRVRPGQIYAGPPGVVVEATYCNQTYLPGHYFHLSVNTTRIEGARLTVITQEGQVLSQGFPASLYRYARPQDNFYSIPPAGCRSNMLSLIKLGDLYLAHVRAGDANITVLGEPLVTPVGEIGVEEETMQSGSTGTNNADKGVEAPLAPPFSREELGSPEPPTGDGKRGSSWLFSSIARASIILGLVIVLVALFSRPRGVRRG